MTATWPAARKRPRTSLVRATREQRNQHHQVRQREQPLIGLNSGCFRCACNEPKMAALGEIVQVVHTNSREISHLIIGKDFLASFDGNHGRWPSFLLRPYFLPV